jgi:site-specific DNA recombinase
MTKKKTNRYAALYERLSHDDELQGESNSISNQKRLLEDYARTNGMAVFRHFTDDGISGTRFDRPGFQNMIAEVRAGNVEAVVIKDMSRFGRDYLEVGSYMEVLRKNDTRLIALNDNVDTIHGEDEFTPFRNIMNEWYARDTSKKIRSAFKAKNLAGKHTSSSVPYGYLKSPDDKNQWIVDPVASKIVKRIFSMAMEGKGPYQIAKILSDEKIEVPAYYHQKLGIGLWKTREIMKPCTWGSSTIVHILCNPSYLGHTVNYRTRKHFKDKKSHYVDSDQWTIIENTQEPIIDQETFDNVQRLRSNIRRYPNGWGEINPLSGLLYCADCGAVMYVHRTNNGKRIPQFTCSNYSKIPVGSLCPTQHRINGDVVMTLVKETLKELITFSKEDEEEFVRLVKETVASKQDSSAKEKEYQLDSLKKRSAELEKLLCRIYEDNILGKLPGDRYSVLDAEYSSEKAKVDKEIEGLQELVDGYEESKRSADKFIELVRRYKNFDEMTNTMLNEFIYKILVHEREQKGRQDSPQTIEIYFNFVGKFETPNMKQEPTAEERELAERKARIAAKRHEQYLRRKSTGWQSTYYWKKKREKKAKMDAMKEALRAEDRENGVYYLPNADKATK